MRRLVNKYISPIIVLAMLALVGHCVVTNDAPTNTNGAVTTNSQ
jgi:hypothetical protein